MNCCDDYGNCRQGRDCPVRVARAKANPRRLIPVSWVFWAVLLEYLVILVVAVFWK